MLAFFSLLCTMVLTICMFFLVGTQLLSNSHYAFTPSVTYLWVLYTSQAFSTIYALWLACFLSLRAVWYVPTISLFHDFLWSTIIPFSSHIISVFIMYFRYNWIPSILVCFGCLCVSGKFLIPLCGCHIFRNRMALLVSMTLVVALLHQFEIMKHIWCMVTAADVWWACSGRQMVWFWYCTWYVRCMF
jgi:hypothetical protein